MTLNSLTGSFEWMVPPARFQRATSRLGGERSMQLSYGSTSANGTTVSGQLSVVIHAALVGALRV
jgi:hypothetical protein